MPERGFIAGRCMLSTREIEVLRSWLISDSKRDVAVELFVTEATVHTHLARIRDKYAAAGRPAPSKVALFVRAVEDGYCTIADVADVIDQQNAESSRRFDIAV